MQASSPEQEALDEIRRQSRLVDQMMTAHSALRDRYNRLSMTMTCSLLGASVIATAFAFAAGDAKVKILGVTGLRSTWLGWFAVITFTATLVDLVIDWRGSTSRHEDAVRQLAALKMEYRTTPAPGNELRERERVSERYHAVMDALPPIPERHFVRLKAQHLRKVELSRILSGNPGMSPRKARKQLRDRFH